MTGHDEKDRVVVISDGAAPSVHANKLERD
jgi:hypothetical protein